MNKLNDQDGVIMLETLVEVGKAGLNNGRGGEDGVKIEHGQWEDQQKCGKGLYFTLCGNFGGKK